MREALRAELPGARRRPSRPAATSRATTARGIAAAVEAARRRRGRRRRRRRPGRPLRPRHRRRGQRRREPRAARRAARAGRGGRRDGHAGRRGGAHRPPVRDRLGGRRAPRRPAAVLQAFFPGEEGGTALAGVLSGRVSPSGRLPVSLPRSAGAQPFSLPAPVARRADRGDERRQHPRAAVRPRAGYTTFERSRPRRSTDRGRPPGGAFGATRARAQHGRPRGDRRRAALRARRRRAASPGRSRSCSATRGSRSSRARRRWCASASPRPGSRSPAGRHARRRAGRRRALGRRLVRRARDRGGDALRSSATCTR